MVRDRPFWWRIAFLASKYVSILGLLCGPVRLRAHPLSITIRNLSGLGTVQSTIVDFYDNVFTVGALGLGPLVVDVGANIGQFVNATKLFCPQARVMCFEPDPDTFADLRANTAAFTGVELFNCGIGARSETMPFHRHVLSAMSSFDHAVPLSRGTISLPVRRLDDLIPFDVSPDLVKIDVEGFERQAIQGGWNTLLRSRYLLVELSLGRDQSKENLQLLRDIAEHFPSASVVLFGRPLGEARRPAAQDALIRLRA